MTDHLTDEQLNEILDGRADSRHLDNCSECRIRLDEFRGVFTTLESLPEARLPHDMTRSILTQLPQKRVFLAWKWLIASQVTAALAITVWLSPSFELPTTILAYQPPNLDSMLASFFAYISSLSIQLPALNIQLPTFTLPPSIMNLQSSTLILLGVSAAALWVIGNSILLHAPTKRSKT